jgi:hypothetical protein
MFKDASWWVCSFFIGLFGYMFGTISNLSALTVISNIATIIAASATTVAAYYAFRSFQSWEERTKKQHRLEHKTASIKELSLCYEMCISDLTVYLGELYYFKKLQRMYQKQDDEHDKRQDDTKRKLEKVHENWARYKCALLFTQSFYKETIMEQYQHQDIIKHQDKVSELASEGNLQEATEALREYANQGTKKIIALYENKN